MKRLNPVPKVAAIHDLSGFGRTSLAVVMPVLTSMGVQVCALPTALLSTNTGGFIDYFYKDLTSEMKGILNHWKALDLKFDAVYSGFLGSSEQIKIVEEVIDNYTADNSLIVIDPVMGDNGKKYGPITDDLVKGMKHLVGKADIITPNFTEASFLLNREFKEFINEIEIKKWLKELSELGPERVIITSVPVNRKNGITSIYAYDSFTKRTWKVECDYIPADYPGTGDLFASVVTGSLMQGDSLPIALDRTVQFVSLSIRTTFGYNIPNREGVLLERVLPNLSGPVRMSSYQLVD